MPKTSSPALYLDLLDASGAPTWVASDTQQLVHQARSRQDQASNRRAELQRQMSRGWNDTGGRDQFGGWDDDFDEDILLAQAVAEVSLQE